jgi:hypothetical protein
MFLAYTTLVEKQIGHQMQRLRIIMEVNMLTNNLQLTALHMEFICNTLFHIHHNKNGVAERNNLKLKDMTNCMIQSKELNLHYWR